MELSDTWFIEGNIDFEAKKYTLLAYLQQVNGCFEERKLYPQLADIIFHFNNLQEFRTNKSFLQNQFPKRLSGVQLQKLTLLYEEMIADDELMAELEDITYFASKRMQRTIATGAAIYDDVEEKLTIAPVGILPLDTKAGYFFLCQPNSSATRVYAYSMFLFRKHQDQYRTMRSQYISEWSRSFTTTYEHIKLELLRSRGEQANPAVYVIEAKAAFPLEETFLPVAKRSLVRYLSQSVA